MKQTLKRKHEHKRIKPVPSKVWRIAKLLPSKLRRQESKLETFRSTNEALLLTRQSLAFYSNRVMAADLG